MYIPYDYIQDYINGELPEDIIREFDEFGKKNIKVSAAINNNDETVPYRVGEYYYNEGNGLYIIVGYDNDEELKEVEELIISLGYSGIGGKRSSGLGRFDIQIADDADELLNMITEKSRLYMTLSVSLPKECEITNSLSEAKYSIIKEVALYLRRCSMIEEKRTYMLLRLEPVLRINMRVIYMM